MAQITNALEAVSVLDEMEYSSCGFPKRYPDADRYQEAVDFIRNLLKVSAPRTLWNGKTTIVSVDRPGGLIILYREPRQTHAYLQPGDDANPIIEILESGDLTPEQIDDLVMDYFPDA